MNLDDIRCDCGHIVPASAALCLKCGNWLGEIRRKTPQRQDHSRPERTNGHNT